MVWSQYVYEATTGFYTSHVSDDEDFNAEIPLNVEDWEIQHSDEQETGGNVGHWNPMADQCANRDGKDATNDDGKASRDPQEQNNCNQMAGLHKKKSKAWILAQLSRFL